MRYVVVVLAASGCTVDPDTGCQIGEPGAVCFVRDDSVGEAHPNGPRVIRRVAPDDRGVLAIRDNGMLVFGPGAYDFAIEVYDVDTLVIQGAGAAETALVGKRLATGFPGESVIALRGDFTSTTHVIVEDLRIEDGYAVGGAAIVAEQRGQSLTIRKALFRNNTAKIAGAVFSAGDLVIEDTEFSSNSAESDSEGGAIVARGSRTRIERSSFVENAAFSGGAASLTGDTATIRDCVFKGNVARSRGGALAVTSVTLQIVDTELSSNAGGRGGAVIATDSRLTLESVSVFSNAASQGGALLLERTRTTVGTSRIDANDASEIGGGLWLVDSDVTLADTSIGSNHATTGPGFALFRVESTSTLTVQHCDVSSNTGDTLDTPAIANIQANATFTPVTGTTSFRCDATGCQAQ